MAYTDQQYADAGQWIAENLGNPELVRAEAARLGLSNDDLLRAAQTQNAGITMGQVQQYMGNGPAPAAGPTLRGYEKNPYLDQMAAGIQQMQTRNLQEQILPGVRSQAIAAGGFGDARHGVAEGLAIGRTNDAIARELANLYSNDYQQTMNRNAQLYQSEMQNQLGYAGLDTQRYGIDTGAATQRYGIDTGAATQRYGIDTGAATQRYGTDKSYEVGMANAAASQANAAANQAVAQGNLALGQQKYGTDLVLGLLDRQMGYNSAGIQMGTSIQNTPMGYYQQFTNSANSVGQGYGNSTQSGGGADPLLGAAGLARIGQSWYANSGGPVTDGGYSVGQGAAYAGTTNNGVFTPFRAGM